MSDRYQHWRALCFVGIAVILSMTAWFSATAIISELTMALKLSSGQATWLTNAVQAGFVVGALGSSLLSLSDIWRLTTLMAFASLAAGIFNIMLLLEPSAAIAITLRFATGVALALIYPPTMKFVATWFKKGRGLAMGAMVGALTLGSAVPHLMRGFSEMIDWESVIIASTACCFAATIIFGFFLVEGPDKFAKTQINLSHICAILKDRPVMLANFGYFGHMWELYAMWGWFLVYATAAQLNGLSVTNVSILTFSVITMGAPGSLICGWLSDRIGRCYSTSLMMVISGSCALLVGLTFEGPAWLFILVSLVWGLTVVADSAQFSAAVTELSDQTLVGSALALQMGVGFAITIFVIWITPVIAELLGGWQWAFVVLVPGPIVGITSMMLLRKETKSVQLAGGRR